ncbi:MAG TPA: O-antigen ligase family protein [Candidatus Sumerlaeota bacterium]|nr:O-antigen ligase family protein [Candidatus Sumerlaeota bacterium]
MNGSLSEHEKWRQRAQAIMFWMGVIFLSIHVSAMTPYTHQLDDIKEVVVRTLGPILMIAYFALLALRLLDPPRKGLAITLGSYYIATAISTLLAPVESRWVAWDGFQLQWSLLGPFFAFMGCSSEKRYVRHTVLFFTLLTLVTTAFGLLHTGVEGRPGVPSVKFQEYAKTQQMEMSQINTLTQKMEEERALAEKEKRQPDNIKLKTLYDSASSIEAKQNARSDTYLFNMVNTLHSARWTMMSLILNRNFYSAFLLLVAPFILASLVLVPLGSWKQVAWISGIVLGICLMSDLTLGYFSQIVPEKYLQILCFLLLPALAFPALSLIRQKWAQHYKFCLICMVVLFLLAGVCLVAHLRLLLLLCVIPVVGGSLWLLVESRAGRGLCAFSLILAVLCLGLSGPKVFIPEDIPSFNQFAISVMENKDKPDTAASLFYNDKNMKLVLSSSIQGTLTGYQWFTFFEWMNKSLANPEFFTGEILKQASVSPRLCVEWDKRNTLSESDVFTMNKAILGECIPQVVGARPYWHGFWAFLLLPVVVVAFLRMPSFTWRMGMVLLFIGAVVSLYMTKSKITLYFALEFEIFMMLCLSIFAARFNFGRPGRLVLATFLLCVVLGTALLAVLPGDRAVGRFTRKFVTEQVRDFENPLTARFILWDGAWQIFKKHWLTGSGIKGYLVFYPYERRPDYNLYEINHVTVFSHNIFLDVLSDTGIIGFITFVSFLGFLYWKCTARLWRSHDLDTRITMICVLGAMTGFLIANLTCPNSRWPIGAGNMWAVLGFMAGMINRRASEESSEVAQWRPTAKQAQMVYVMLGLSILGFGVTTTNAYHFFRGSMLHNDGLKILGNPPENPGPLARYLDNISALQRESRKPGLTAAQKARNEQQINYYIQQFGRERDNAIGLFRESIKENPTFLTSYYKLASILSMGNGLQVTKDNLEQALATYKQMQEYSAEFSQTRYNLGMLYYRLLSIERMEQSRAKADPKFDQVAAEARIKELLKNAIVNFRMEAARTIVQGSCTEYLVDMLLTEENKRPDTSILAEDILDASAFLKKVNKGKDPLSQKLQESLAEVQTLAKNVKPDDPALAEAICAVLNKVLAGPTLLTAEEVQKLQLTPRMQRRMGYTLEGEEALMRNRALLNEVYKDSLQRHPEDEAVQALATLYDSWRIILVEDKGVRRTPDQIREEVWNWGMEYIQYAARTNQLVEAQDLLFRLSELPRTTIKALQRRAQREENRTAQQFLQGMDSLEDLRAGLARTISEAYERKNNPAGALAFMQTYLQHFPGDTAGRLDLAQMLRESGRLREAMEQALLCEKLDPAKKEVVYQLFKIEEAANNRPKATEYAQRCTQAAGLAPSLKQEAVTYLAQPVTPPAASLPVSAPVPDSVTPSQPAPAPTPVPAEQG